MTNRYQPSVLANPNLACIFLRNRKVLPRNAGLSVPKRDDSKLRMFCNLRVDGMKSPFSKLDSTSTGSDKDQVFWMCNFQHIVDLFSLADDPSDEIQLEYLEERVLYDASPLGVLLSEPPDVDPALDLMEHSSIADELNSASFDFPTVDNDDAFNVTLSDDFQSSDLSCCLKARYYPFYY